MNFVMRADASTRIGTGHVRRCLAIAESLVEKGATVRFATRMSGEYSTRLFHGAGVDVIELPDGRDDAEISREAIAGRSAASDWLVVDHYSLDARWEQELRPLVGRILVIDDLANRTHDADLLLDPNLYRGGATRYRRKVPPGCRLLLGPRHAPLRAEFRRAHAVAAPRTGDVRRMLVFFGGGPLAAACTLSAIRALANLEHAMGVEVVFNAGEGDREAIAAACLRHGFGFHHATNRIAELMCGAELAIGAGGTSLWERCCVGLPCITYPLAENQRLQVKDAAAAGIVVAPESDPLEHERVAEEISACCANPAMLAAMSRASMALVDGRGIERLMLAFGLGRIRVRRAVPADCGALLDWRNDPAIRRASRDAEPIAAAVHRAWFDSVLADSNRLLLIGEIDGAPAGVVRFDIERESADVSIYLVPGQSGRGLGAELLFAAEECLAEARPDVRTVRAEVLPGNEPSHALFRSSGYAPLDSAYAKAIRP